MILTGARWTGEKHTLATIRHGNRFRGKLGSVHSPLVVGYLYEQVHDCYLVCTSCISSTDKVRCVPVRQTALCAEFRRTSCKVAGMGSTRFGRLGFEDCVFGQERAGACLIINQLANDIADSAVWCAENSTAKYLNWCG